MLMETRCRQKKVFCTDRNEYKSFKKLQTSTNRWPRGGVGPLAAFLRVLFTSINITPLVGDTYTWRAWVTGACRAQVRVLFAE